MKIMQGMTQGDAAWLAHRSSVRNASDAPAMMGVSPYVSRSDLIKRYATGIVPDVDARTQAIFDRGHEVEPALRALAESMIGEDLYPVIGVSDDGYLGASFDGATMGEDVIFEAKQSNAEKMDMVSVGQIPPQDYWQIVQQFAVCESAQSCYYLVGDGTQEGTAWLAISRKQIESDIPKLLAGWRQFDADVAAYKPEPVATPEPVARQVEGFGALSLRVEGRVLASNLDAFKADAEAFIARLPKPGDLQTDQDFVDADRAVKSCAVAENNIVGAIDAVLAQMSDVDAVLRIAGNIRETIRTARLALEKAFKSEKESRKADIVRNGFDAVQDHYLAINDTLGEHAIGMPASLRNDISSSIKNLRTLSSITNAVDTAVAHAKIAASQRADAIRACISVMDECAKGHESLFADRVALCASKAPDDLRNLVKLRISEHEQREAARIEQERERIRNEELARIERERTASSSAAGAPEAQQPLLESAKITGVAAGSRNDSASESVTHGSLPPTSILATRPTDDAIIHVLSTTYAIDSATVIEWLRAMDLDAASRALAA